MFSTDATESEVALDEVFEALAHEYRRRLLAALARRPAGEAVRPASVHRPVDGPVRAFECRLHHVHLPKLDRAGFVDWDHADDRVTAGPRFDEVEPLIALLADERTELAEDWP